MSDYLAVTFLCVVLFLKCGNSIQDCNDFLNIHCNAGLNESCIYKEENWYFTSVEVHRIKSEENRALFKKDDTKKLFKHLDLIAFPTQQNMTPAIYGKIQTSFCINFSRHDIIATDGMELKFVNDEHTDVVTISNRQENCTENHEPFATFCFWTLILVATNETTLQLQIKSKQSYQEFRFRLPKWESYNYRREKKYPCDFSPFVYSTHDKIYVKFENCTSRLNATIFGHENANISIIQTFQNITLDKGLTLDQPSNLDSSAYFSCKVDIPEDKTTLNLTFSTEDLETTEPPLDMYSDGIDDRQTSSQSYVLLYLIPFTFCLVLTIAFLILRPEIKFIWKKITGQVNNTKPTVKFLYCKCSSHAVCAKQLEALINFVGKYCNVNIEDVSEKEYEDSEALLRRRNTDTDYVVLVPMPENENDPEAQNLEEEFKNAKDKKRITLQIPFENNSNLKNFESPGAHFKLMDDFIPFIQHLHRKYSSERRDFLTLDKIMDIKQKLEDNHLTDGGFEFLTNQFAEDDSNLQNNKINGYHFPDLNDLNL